MRPIATSIALLVILCFVSISSSKESPVEVLGYLPDKGFSPVGPAEHFLGKKLFVYMNGGAELYLAYGFVDLGVREYKSGQQSAGVAIYRIKRPEGAFGLFLAVASGQPVVLDGVSAVSSPGVLSFYKGKVLVRIVAKSDIESEKTKGFLLKLAKQVAAKLPGKMLKRVADAPLPKGWTKGSLRYLINPDTTQTIWFNGEGKILLSEQATAFTAFYAEKQGDLQATQVSYPSPLAAKTACSRLAEELDLKRAEQKPGCEVFGKGPDEMHHLVRTAGSVLVWIAGASDMDTAKAWVKRTKLSGKH